MLDTRLLHWTPLTEKNSLNTRCQKKFTRVRGRLFLPSHDLQKTLEDTVETIVLKIDWTQTARARNKKSPLIWVTRDFRKQNKDYCTDYCIGNRLYTNSTCTKNNFLHCFDLQETFENKIETIVSEIDRTHTARARKKNCFHYFDLQETFENKIETIYHK